MYDSIRKAATSIDSDIKTILPFRPGLGQASPVLGRRGREKSQKEKGINTPYRKRYLISIKPLRH